MQVLFRYIIRFTLLVTFYYIKSVLESKKLLFGSFYDFFHSLIQFLIFFTILNIATALLIMVYRLRKKIAYKYTDNVINGINNIYYLLLGFGIILMIFGFWGVNFKEFLTSISIFAAALAIISKDYISTLMNGIIISFSKELNIDDYVKIGEIKGKIIDINLSKVVLQNDDDDILYLPNDKVYQSEIINYTKRDIKKISIDFELSLSNHTTIEDLESRIVDALKDFHDKIIADSYNIKIVSVYHEFLVLKFQYMLIEVNRDIERQIRKRTIRVIANMLNQNKED
ncbi:MAG: mechanosensitive ion channel [Saprospiraceae bacterium]